MTETVEDVSIVICAYTEERWQDLLAAITSVREQTVRPREIILVIDHNTTLLARARQALPDVIVMENFHTRGLSGARNSGIASAQGKIIAFMDEDAVAAPDWLACLEEHYRDPQVWGVGGLIAPLWLQGRPDWFPPEFDWVVGCTYRGVPQTTHHVRNLIGCNMSFRQEAFQKIGGFRSEVGRIGNRPIGCEETELCIRLHQQQPQAQLLYEPQSQVFHKIPVTRANWRYFVARCYAEGLSKALVTRYVGADAGLSTERAYTFHVLPLGLWRGLQDTVRGHDANGLRRAAAIVAGLLITAAGYAYGQLTFRWSNWRSSRGSINLSSEQL
jgi:GT2 family glycosyltransferase